MIRRRLADLEARIEALEAAIPVDYAMPPRPDLGSTPVDGHGMWREQCADYSNIVMYDVDDDRAYGVYI